MKKLFLALFLVFFTNILTVNAQKTISGVKLDAKISLDGKELVLNGAGIREKWWIDLYVGSLYLESTNFNPKSIIEGKDVAVIKLDIVSGLITADKLATAIDEGFYNSTNNNVAAFKNKIDMFKSFIKEKINKGDVFVFSSNSAGDAISVYKNGIKKGSIDGYDFKKAVFGIWLGSKPADAGLKNEMLGY